MLKEALQQPNRFKKVSYIQKSEQNRESLIDIIEKFKSSISNMFSRSSKRLGTRRYRNTFFQRVNSQILQSPISGNKTTKNIRYSYSNNNSQKLKQQRQQPDKDQYNEDEFNQNSQNSINNIIISPLHKYYKSVQNSNENNTDIRNDSNITRSLLNLAPMSPIKQKKLINLQEKNLSESDTEKESDNLTKNQSQLSINNFNLDPKYNMSCFKQIDEDTQQQENSIMNNTQQDFLKKKQNIVNQFKKEQIRNWLFLPHNLNTKEKMFKLLQPNTLKEKSQDFEQNSNSQIKINKQKFQEIGTYPQSQKSNINNQNQNIELTFKEIAKSEQTLKKSAFKSKPKKNQLNLDSDNNNQNGIRKHLKQQKQQKISNILSDRQKQTQKLSQIASYDTLQSNGFLNIVQKSSYINGQIKNIQQTQNIQPHNSAQKYNAYQKQLGQVQNQIDSYKMFIE
ncbi:hypothetical protein PPERSA_06644 [Pseudocohnilembus persalinus]|uniref:Uncharacterized protein n=1 Tax=Pseudocohnilembus persalinus TaxID=266149 RepID=A0A0V0QRR3_PSEPJ|nr:hypothetical protein PPERSA_06644 [Pseudocohnilembus persalinus]|eukprot:KRX05010.1 hypothetical protein PPERSA_06644 [Pseudocohnilembus persalinus]